MRVGKPAAPLLMGARSLGVFGLASLLLAAGDLPTIADPVADAASRGDIAAVRALLSQGTDVNGSQPDGMTALHWAAERGDRELALLLLSAGADAMAATRIGQYTPLHLASRRGNEEVGKLLVDAGARVQARTTNSGVTPLHLAAAAAHGEALVNLLLEAGANPGAVEASADQTPLMFAAAYGRTPAIRALINGGADPASTTRVVDVARRVAKEHAARAAFRNSLEEARQRDHGGADWEASPLQLEAAIAAEREAFLSESGEGEGEVRLSIRETLVGKTGGMTALLHAVREGHAEASLALLDAGADVNQVSAGDGTSPLLMAALNGHFDLALELLDRGADPNLAASTDGATPLFAVLQTQWAAQTLYPQPRAQDLQDSEYIEVMAALLEAGADPNVQLNSHLWYWEYGYTRIGIDIKGATPFWRAAFAQDLEALRLLVAHGADPHVPTSLPPVELRETRQLDGRAQEDSGLPPVPEGAPNAYPIHAAAGGGYTGLGAWTVRAVPDGFLPAVRYLVDELGADVNALDWWGFTPLHYAASRGDNEMIRYLVSKGADVTALTRLGQSPADLARGGQGGFFTRRAFPETQALLESLGSPLVCLHVHFAGTGDTCHAAGTTPFEDIYGFPREPLTERGGRNLRW